MYPSFLVQALLCIWLSTEGASRKEITGRDISNAVFVEIKPAIFQSKNVIKIEPVEKRLKRDKTVENPSLVLEFSPGFFSNPKLKDLYDAITGARENNHQNSFVKTGLISAKEIEKALQINPLNFKRELRSDNQKSKGGFFLKLNPQSVARINPVRTYKLTCTDKESNEQWCSTTILDEEKCPVTEPTIITTTTCHPTLPEITTKKKHFCGPNFKDHRISAQPCLRSTTPAVSTTEYTPCKSLPPPSVMPEWGPATMVVCKDRTTICYKAVTDLSETTKLATQKCDNFQQCIHSEPERYFILFKRSPLDSWSKARRKKRERHKLGTFKFKLVPTTN